MKFGILCASDRCSAGVCEDKSGALLQSLVAPFSAQTDYCLVPDDRAQIEKALISLSDDAHADIILTTGGTGFAPRDVTPEATLAVIDRLSPGISEAIRGKTLIINLPGSPKAVQESFEVIAPIFRHAVETLSGNTQSCGGNYGK